MTASSHTFSQREDATVTDQTGDGIVDALPINHTSPAGRSYNELTLAEGRQILQVVGIGLMTAEVFRKRSPL